MTPAQREMEIENKRSDPLRYSIKKFEYDEKKLKERVKKFKN